ncbi:uncharacterized protein LOC129876881 isoform X1 [Solanum dulcamara]|uniref:uncharacterized protein LOC129876881 isoform X1 n=1 Tax=Solanum dulcamara TaxID=45834 RepID=UPI002486224D|nr:uncharacterized protein LOC129876881 isoform X1 [Solanum dulcamara]
MATGYYGMIEELHVVLVDHEQENTTEMVDLLKSYDYEGCFPKDIVEIMNVPGLTRMQLVIYRYRSYKYWRIHQIRLYVLESIGTSLSHSKGTSFFIRRLNG